MSPLSWIRGILAEWWPFVADRKAWRAARKAKATQDERKTLSEQYRVAKKHHRKRDDLVRRLNELTLLELELGNRQ